MMKPKSKNRRGRKNPVDPVPHPPPISGVTLLQRRHQRYVATANTVVNITYQNLLDSVLIASSATQGFQLFEAVRVVKVECWYASMSSAIGTVSVEFNGLIAGFVGDQKVHQDSSMATRPAHVVARPGKNTAAAFFQPSSGSSCFQLTAPSGTIVDVVLEFRGQFNFATPVAFALVGALTGGVYMRGLDGLPLATSLLQPPVSSAWIK